MKVIWTPEAQKDREDIWKFIAKENPFATTRMDELFSEAAARLTEHSMLGKAGRIPGTRELFPHESYRMVYEIGGDTVWILTLVHAAVSGRPIAAANPRRQRRCGRCAPRPFGVALRAIAIAAARRCRRTDLLMSAVRIGDEMQWKAVSFH